MGTGSIVTDRPSSAKHYVLMDMKSLVVSTGTLNKSVTCVKVLTAGSYIVKIESKYKQKM